MPRTVAFVTHVAAEGDLASALKRAIETDFSGAISVFVSSDPSSVGAGDRWFDKLMAEIDECSVQILLLSPAALDRPWVHFEAGAAWGTRKTQVPLCHSGLDPGQLPMPLSQLQAGRLGDPAYLRSLYGKLADAASQNIPPVDFNELARRLTDVASTIVSALLPATEPRDAQPALSDSEALRLVVLEALRQLGQDEARTGSIEGLDIGEVARQSARTVSGVKSELVDLLSLGFAAPHVETFGHGAADGAAKITAPGMRELERLRGRRAALPGLPDLRRTRLLEALDQTQRQMVATLADAMATIAGPGATRPGRFDADAYPKADPLLAGSLPALLDFYAVLTDLHGRRPGTGLTVADASQVGRVQAGIRAALQTQEERAINGEPLAELNAEEKIQVVAAIKSLANVIGRGRQLG